MAEEALEILTLLHLIITLTKKHAPLDPNLKKEMELIFGWIPTKEELLSDPETFTLHDCWHV